MMYFPPKTGSSVVQPEISNSQSHSAPIVPLQPIAQTANQQNFIPNGLVKVDTNLDNKLENLDKKLLSVQASPGIKTGYMPRKPQNDEIVEQKVGSLRIRLKSKTKNACTRVKNC